MKFNIGNESHDILIESLQQDHHFVLKIDEKIYEGFFVPISDHFFHLQIRNQAANVYLVEIEGKKLVFVNGKTSAVEPASQQSKRKKTATQDGMITPPMPSVLTKIFVSQGSSVQKGSPLIVVSAMKMEHTLVAPKEGSIVKIHTSVGNQVMPGDNLIEIM